MEDQRTQEQGAPAPGVETRSLGAVLSAARRSAGMTVEQLSALTRIREAIIHAFERDEFSQCGGDFYERGHIKALSRALGLDPEAMVHLYDELHGGDPPAVRMASVFRTDRRLRAAERRSPNWSMALGVALSLVVVFGIVRVMGGAGGTHEAGVEQIPAVPTLPAPGVHQRAKPAPPRAGASVKPTVAANQVVVQVKAKRSSYVNVADATGRKLFAGMMEAGMTSTWRAPDRVDLEVSDATAVSVQVNGKKVGKLGTRGQTVRRSFGPPAPPAR
ncbi:hypothetical protein GCM10010149_60660 [Nonomuraea roseoviolacea subsp. roseoviolacea]|uniref:Cytoskeletal protein RodZ n=1 Tax=Nonomuraea roseoviolacea subsp. carminata TaxID=160689 RepID=A0ABT1JTJ6_9ACTN|nr:helix-turn-helix domain-containing protein [Nonomuraea roseoviolacea]MCP2344920.1 cytoskeletal protein RodZ [Nonomuraea roseoviolacea subsp. carminata]